MKLSLSPLNPKSRAECQELVEFINTHYPSPFPLEYKDTQSGKYQFFWAHDAESGDLIGSSGLMPKTPFLVESVKSVVDPRYRGKGWGERLSVAIEEQARALGFKKIMTTIYVTNLQMIFIKLKQGYLFEGFHPDHEKPGLHEYSLGKRLA